MKRLFAALVAATLMTVLAVGTAAAVPAFTHATGGIGLSSPMQYISFNAFDYGETGDRGTVNYTNFEQPWASNVWNVSALSQITFWLGATPYVHTVSIATLTPTSTTSTNFSGTGTDVLANPTTITGTVSGSTIAFTITGTDFVLSGSGSIAADGSMAGSATAVQLGVTTAFTWTAPAGSAFSVLNYTGAVSCAVVGGSNATFVFSSPFGPIVAKVHDGGSPGTNGDTYGHGLATSACDGPVVFYPIVSGNLVVH